MNKCEKPKCQYSITRKKCISPNPYIEKIAECGRNNIKIKECIKTYNKINDRKLSCDRMTDRLNYEKKLKIKASKISKIPKDLKSLSMLPNKSKPSIQKYNYTALNKFINIPKDHNELKTITTNWILRNSDYVIQPLGGTKGEYDITSINDIMVAKLEDSNNITVGTNIYIKNMEKTGIFTETPDIYAICELYGVIINLFVWIPKTKTLNKISYIPWKYNTKKKIATVLSKNTILSMVLINNHYYSLEHNDIIDKYKPSNNIEKIINNALIKKYNMHLYNKVCYNNDNCFYNIIIRQLQLLNTRIK